RIRLFLAALVAVALSVGAQRIGAQQQPLYIVNGVPVQPAAAAAAAPSIEELVAYLPTAAGTDAPVWLADNRLVYLNNDDGALWAVSADGGAPTQLTSVLVRGEPQPVWRAGLQLRSSPAGRS